MMTLSATNLEDSDVEWHSVDAALRREPVAVKLIPMSIPPTEFVRRPDGSGDGPVRSDFWSSLTRLELESRTSGVAAAGRLPENMPATAHIAEKGLAVRALLTDAVKRLAPVLHAIIASKAARSSFPIEEAYFDVDHDYEEDSTQLVVVIRTRANAAQTFALWNSLDYELDRWMLALSPSDREIVTNQLGLRFVWKGSASGE